MGRSADRRAAALKVMPILFAPYFLWRRQWRAALFTGVSAIGWSLLPAAVYGWTAYWDQLTASRKVVRVGWNVDSMNLSTYAMFDRWLGHGIVPFTVRPFEVLPRSGNSHTILAAGGLLALVALLGLWLFRGRYNPKNRAALAEWSTVFLVASVFGTVTWKNYLVVLLLPMTLFVATSRNGQVELPFRRKLRTLAWLAFVLGVAGGSDVVQGNLARRLQTGSILTLMSLLILGTLFWYRSRILSATAVADVDRGEPDTINFSEAARALSHDAPAEDAQETQA